MVDTTEAMESQYLTADTVKNSTTKTLTVIGGGEYKDTEWGRRLTLTAQIEGKSKEWRPNRDSVKNLSEAWGIDSIKWVGKQAKLQVISINSKDSIIATPLVTVAEGV